MNDKKYEKPFKLDMDFDEALTRFGQTDPRELASEELPEDQKVRLVAHDDTGDKFLVYGTEKGTQVELRYEGDTFWATQKQMASMFGVTADNISLHLKNIFKEGELIKDSVTEESSVTAADGKNYQTNLYNLNALISVGYRINSKQGTMFRIWATDKLFQILTKGFYVDVERLTSPDAPLDQISELRKIVDDLRLSEHNVYREVRQLCTMCQDYDPKSRDWQRFFARMQNKLFWATVQMVATQLRLERADANKPNMGLTTWKKDRLIQADTLIAKNYLAEPEIERMNRLSILLLNFIEDQLKEERISIMAEMESAMDKHIKDTGRPLLPERGINIPTKGKADQHCKEQYAIFNNQRAMMEGEPDTRAISGGS